MSYVIRIESPEGPLKVVEPVFDQLFKEGMAFKHEDGTFHTPSKPVLEQWIAEHGICDFCSIPNPQHTILVPDFYMFDGLSDKSTGGWATCDECYRCIQENRRADLLRRSIDYVGSGKFGAAAIKGLHQQFWTARDAMVDAAGVGAALMDFVEDKIPAVKVVKGRDARLEAVRRLTGLTQDEMDALQHGDATYKDVTKKLSDWAKKYRADGPSTVKILTEMMVHSQMPQGHVPHWQQAIDAKFSSLKILTNSLDSVNKVMAFSTETNLSDPKAVAMRLRQVKAVQQFRNLNYKADIQGLRVAEVYSFNAETMHAIIDGGQSIPHESPLSSVNVPPSSAGWFWFAEPFPVTASPVASDTTAALLWGWVHNGGEEAGGWDPAIGDEPVLRFSAYVKEDKAVGDIPAGQVLPSTRWYWPLSMSFHQMLAFNLQSYREHYGPGGKYESEVTTAFTGEEATMKVVSELSLFFMMSCVWFKQRILVEAPAHVERHARKRYVKEHKLAAVPTVRVVALRRAQRDEDAVHTPEGGERHYFKDYRIIVDGHSKLQRCGPGGKDRKLIWVMPYPKGPEEAPFRPKAQKVFAVVR